MPKKPVFPKSVTDALLHRLKVTKTKFNKDLIAALSREDFKKIQTRWWKKKFGRKGLDRKKYTIKARKNRWGYYKKHRMGPAANLYPYIDWSGVMRGACTDKAKNLSYWRGDIYFKPAPLDERHKRLHRVFTGRGISFFNKGGIREALNKTIPEVAKRYLKKLAAEVEKAAKAGGIVSVKVKKASGKSVVYHKKIRAKGGYSLRTGPTPFGRFL